MRSVGAATDSRVITLLSIDPKILGALNKRSSNKTIMKPFPDFSFFLRTSRHSKLQLAYLCKVEFIAQHPRGVVSC